MCFQRVVIVVVVVVVVVGGGGGGGVAVQNVDCSSVVWNQSLLGRIAAVAGCHLAVVGCSCCNCGCGCCGGCGCNCCCCCYVFTVFTDLCCFWRCGEVVVLVLIALLVGGSCC